MRSFPAGDLRLDHGSPWEPLARVARPSRCWPGLIAAIKSGLNRARRPPVNRGLKPACLLGLRLEAEAGPRHWRAAGKGLKAAPLLAFKRFDPS